jgi:uncharacterized protein (DUF1800 family)
LTATLLLSPLQHPVRSVDVKGDAVKRIAIGLSGIVALAVAGCSGLQSSEWAPQNTGVKLSPSVVTLRGGSSQAFIAAAAGTPAPSFVWAVNGVSGGNATTGTISATGQYTAPEFPPSPNSVSITATESSDPTKSASAKLTLQNPTPQVTGVSPASIPVGAFTVTVTGAHFAPGAVVDFNGAALTTTRVSSTQLTATGSATTTEIGSASISVTNPKPGSTASGSMSAEIVKTSPVALVVSPATATVHAGGVQNFAATVSGTSNNSVVWSVNGQGGGTSVIGYLTSQGNYLAPSSVPSPNTVTIVATSVADPSKSSSATVTLVNPVPTVTGVSPANIGVGAFSITVTGTGFVPGSVINFGGQALATQFISGVELTANGNAAASQVGNVAVAVQNPDPGGSTSSSLNALVVNGGSGSVSAAAADRFLEQSTFGPTPELVNQVQQTGFDTFLQGQFSAPTSTYPTPAASDSGLTNVQNAFFVNAVNDPDQLRQRVAFALNELWVVGENKVSDPTGYSNYMTALNNDAFGNYYNVMKDVTLTPAMGHWLDMVDNVAPAPGQHANENYARECMQLFTLGLSLLNPDGTPMVDGTGTPIPTYTQNDVMSLGRSFTGWTYPTMPGATLMKHNPSYYGGNMVVGSESDHDSGAKTFLGQSIPAGQSAEQELDTVLTIIFNHPNLGPFVATQLIEKLVTSNPSPAYVQRVAQAFNSGTFNSYGSGKRGDMQATIAAILLDPEARRGDSPATTVASDGKLREPVVMVVSIARAFHATTDGTGFEYFGSTMSQDIFNSPSVFNFYPPASLIPQTTLNGPEFAIFNTNTSLARVNFINSIVYGQISGGTKLNFTPVISAGTTDQMVAWLNTLFLHGTMSSDMQTSINTTLSALSSTDTTNQAKTAIYLVTSSSQYQIQR